MFTKILTKVTFLVFFISSLNFSQEIEANLAGNTTTDGFSVKNKLGNVLFRVNGDGNVGIGTMDFSTYNQTANFAVKGYSMLDSVRISGTDWAENTILIDRPDGFGIVNQGGPILFRTGGDSPSADRMIIDINGNVAIGTTLTNAKLRVVGEEFGGMFNGNTAIVASGVEKGISAIGVNYAGVDAISNKYAIHASGLSNGYGVYATSGPTGTAIYAKGGYRALYADGDIEYTGALIGSTLKITGGSPGIGKVLTSDATGLASWTTPTSSPWTIIDESSIFYKGRVGIGPDKDSIGGANPSITKFHVLNYDFNGIAVYGGSLGGYGTGGFFQGENKGIHAIGPTAVYASGGYGVRAIGTTYGVRASGDVRAILAEGDIEYTGTLIGPTLKITGGSPGIGKVLTSDAAGLASWTIPPSSPWTINDNSSISYSGKVSIGNGNGSDYAGFFNVIGSGEMIKDNDLNPTSINLKAGNTWHKMGNVNIQAGGYNTVSEGYIRLMCGLVEVWGGGLVYGSWDEVSDVRFKKNINPIVNGLEKVLKMNGVTFEWDKEKAPKKNFPQGVYIGFIAQDLEKIVPELVHTDAEGIKSVAYQNMTPLLVEAIKQQQLLIEKQNDKIKELQDHINELRTEFFSRK
jgi:hypothetical protein